MEYLLPTELARLVYGYLRDQGCEDVAKMFLEKSPLMRECLEFVNKGRNFSTKVMGATLNEFVERVTEAAVLVEDELGKPEIPCQFTSCLNGIKTILLGKDPDDPTALRILPKKIRVDASSSTADLSGDENDDEAERRAFEALLSNKELHEKLAENINKVFESGSIEEQSKTGVDKLLEKKMLETIVDNTEKDPVFERILEELVGPDATALDSSQKVDSLEETVEISETIDHSLVSTPVKNPPVDSPTAISSKVTIPLADSPVENGPLPSVKPASLPSSTVVLTNAKIGQPIQFRLLRVPAATSLKTATKICTTLPVQKTSTVVTRSSKIVTRTTPVTYSPLWPRPPPPPIRIDILDDLDDPKEPQNETQPATQTINITTPTPAVTANTVSTISLTGVRARGGKRGGRGGVRNVKVHVPKVKNPDSGANIQVEKSKENLTQDLTQSTDEDAVTAKPRRTYVAGRRAKDATVKQSQESKDPVSTIPPNQESSKEQADAPMDLTKTVTPHQAIKSNSLKGKSLSTPRKKSHVRTLEFGSPTDSTAAKRCLTSPKSCRSSPPLNLDKVKRSALFNSPAKGTPPPQPSLSTSWDAALRKCFSGSDPEDIPTSVGLRRKRTPAKKTAPVRTRKTPARRKKPQPKAGSSTPELSIISEEEEKIVEKSTVEKQATVGPAPSNDSMEIEPNEPTPPQALLNQPALETSTPLKPPDSLPPGFDPQKTPFMTPISKIIHEETSACVKLLTPTSLMTPALNRFEFDPNSMTNSPGALERVLIRECSRIERGDTVVTTPPTTTVQPLLPPIDEPVVINPSPQVTQRSPAKTPPVRAPSPEKHVEPPVVTSSPSASSDLASPVQTAGTRASQVETTNEPVLSPVLVPEPIRKPRAPSVAFNSGSDSSDETNSVIISRCISIVKSSLYSAEQAESKSSKPTKKKNARSKSKSRKKPDKRSVESRKSLEKKRKRVRVILPSSTDDDISAQEQPNTSGNSPQITTALETDRANAVQGNNVHQKQRDNTVKSPQVEELGDSSKVQLSDFVPAETKVPDFKSPKVPNRTSSKHSVSERTLSHRPSSVGLLNPHKTPDPPARTSQRKSLGDYTVSFTCNDENGDSVQRVLKMTPCIDIFDLPRDLPAHGLKSALETGTIKTMTLKTKDYPQLTLSHPSTQIRQLPKKRKRDDSPRKKDKSNKKPRSEPEDRKVEKRRSRIDPDDEPSWRRHERSSRHEFSNSRDYDRSRRYDGRNNYERPHWPLSSSRRRSSSRSPSPTSPHPPSSSSSRRYSSGRPPWPPSSSSSYHRPHRPPMRREKDAKLSPHRTPKEKFTREEHKAVNAKRETRDVHENKPSHSTVRDSLEEGEISESSSMTPAIQFKTSDMKITVESNRLLSGGEDTQALLKRVDLEKFLSLLHGSTNSK